ncbi:MAG: cysteine desulfurase family protein [Hyphomicrobiaceae bacterium]
MTGSRIYLDHNASAPLRPEARAAMLAAFDLVGNPSSVHAEGRRARALVEDAREEVALLVGASPGEVVFTSGATESNAWVMGAGWRRIALAGVEHSSVIEPARGAAAQIAWLPVDGDGRIDPAATAGLAGAPEAGGALITVQMANNETGIVQPIEEIAGAARAAGLVLHSDAVQAAGRMRIDVRSLGIDFLSLSAHKLGGPKGVGALIIRDGASLRPMFSGGGQELRRRAGTQNVAGIAGFGAAARAAREDLAATGRIRARRDLLERAVKRFTPGVEIIGESVPRLPNTSAIAWPGKTAAELVMRLDLDGIAVSAGAACSSGKVGESHVLKAMGVPAELSRSTIRVSLGAETGGPELNGFLTSWLAIRGPLNGERTDPVMVDALLAAATGPSMKEKSDARSS